MLEVFKEKFRGKIFYSKGCEVKDKNEEYFEDAIEKARMGEIIIFAGGESSGFGEKDTVGEGKDSHDLKLPGSQEELILKLSELGKPLILILINGRPLVLTDIHDKVDAIVECWFPGEETANAIFNIITGREVPSGKLPVSFPKHSGQIPVYYHRKEISKEKKYVYLDSSPLFPFGYGLSYTEFKYSSLEISPEEIEPSENVKISFYLENTGEFKGSEIVQLYVRKKYSSIVLPSISLKGFEKVKIKPGEKVKVEFILPAEILAFHSEDMKLTIEEGDYEVMIGSSSNDIKLKGNFRIKESKKMRGRKKFFSRVKVIKL